MFLVYHVISKNHVIKGSFDFMGSQVKLSSSPISWPKALRKYNGFHLSRDIMVFVCHVTLQDHVIKVFNDLAVRSPSRYVTIIPSLVAIDTVAVEIQLLQFVTLPKSPGTLWVGTHQGKLPSCQVWWPQRLWQWRCNDFCLSRGLTRPRDQSVV